VDGEAVSLHGERGRLVMTTKDGTTNVGIDELGMHTEADNTEVNDGARNGNIHGSGNDLGGGGPDAPGHEEAPAQEDGGLLPAAGLPDQRDPGVGDRGGAAESKAEIGRRLSMPPIRVWQMGQRALSGMVAALLTPPSGRRGAMPRIDPETKELRKRVAELEAETDLQRRLIKLLRTMPGNEHRELPKEEIDAKRAPRKRKPAKAVERALPPPGRGAGPEPTSA
jgi:hypothetical protein